jgi:hypothetical protein
MSMNRRSILRTLASLPILGVLPVQAVEHKWIKNPYHKIFFNSLYEQIQSPKEDILFKLEDSGRRIIIEMIHTYERWEFPTTESPPNQGSFYEEQIRLYPDSKIDFYDIRYKNLSNIFAKITT